jgi:phosphomannomutase/phosphoglucomutase
VRTLNGHIDGTFPGRPSEPTEANLGDLMRAVPAFGADLGIAHDGDADRAVFVDRNGRFVPGESLLTLLSQDAVERYHGGFVVTPVTMSQALADAITPLGGEVIYTRVGSPNVTREMQARHAILGGEENGGIVFPQFQLARDGAMAAASLLDLLARRSETLDALIAGVPHYAFVREKVPCPAERREEVLRRAAEALSKGADRVERTDGLKVYRGKSWILVRPSGTEPLVRIFAEANEPHRARNLADEGVRAVREALAAH